MEFKQGCVTLEGYELVDWETAAMVIREAYQRIEELEEKVLTLECSIEVD